MVQTFIMSGKTSNFITNYSPSIQLDPNKKYEAALLAIDLYNSIPNVTPSNNVFKYSTNYGLTYKTIQLDTGSYELSAINAEIQRQMIINKDYNEDENTFYITILPNVSKLGSIIKITKESYEIDFGVENSLGPLLGYGQSKIDGTIIYNESPNIVDILKVNSILVHLDICMGNYVNGTTSPVIYSFFPNVSPGYKIVERPKQLIYCPVSRTEISSMNCWLTDQNNDPIDLRGETITVRICIREIKNIKKDILDAVKQLKIENLIKI